MTTPSHYKHSLNPLLQFFVGLLFLLGLFAISQQTTAATGDVTDLAIQLTASGNFPKAMNADVLYPVSIKASNKGPSVASNPTITVTLPDGITASGLSSKCSKSAAVVTCSTTSLAVGKKFNVAFKIKAGETAIGAGSVTAAVTSAETDSTPENNTVTTAVTIGSIYDISVTKSGTQNGAITGSVGLDCGDICKVTVKSKKAAGDKISLKAIPGFHQKLVQWSGSPCTAITAPPSCTFKAKTGQSYSIDASFGVAPEEKVVLLLHGMNTDPSTWKNFVKKNFSTCYTINNGVVIGDTGKKFPVNCYAVKFGAYDAGGDPGLEDARSWAIKHKLATSGDFSSFVQLGKEVDKAVGVIKAFHPGAHILMIGHSRGGLAARAFLSNKTAAAPYTSLWTDYVDGLITTGSPHKGTPVGKIYPWLDAHPRGSCDIFSDCYYDWKAVDELALLLRSVNSGLDARRPVIAYLASGSKQLQNLNAGVLPTSVVTGQIRYSGLNLGKLSKSYDIFPSGRNGGKDSLLAIKLTNPAIDYMLGAGVNSTDTRFQGDGIVPLSSQGYEADVDKKYENSKVFHTDEPSRVADINSMVCNLATPDLPALTFTDWVKCP